MHTAQITNNLYAAWSDEYTRDNSSTVLLDLEQEVRERLAAGLPRRAHAHVLDHTHPHRTFVAASTTAPTWQCRRTARRSSQRRRTGAWTRSSRPRRTSWRSSRSPVS